MTCKISFSKSILETLRHHLAVIITTCIIFFIQFIVFFLNIQNIHSSLTYRVNGITNMTLPYSGYAIPVVFIAVIIAFDFFRYLHSKKQTDFYDSLPVKRQDWFMVRFVSSFLIFMIPYTICTALEMFLLIIFQATKLVYFTNLLWTFICMILVFLYTWVTAALAMILSGHSVIAFFLFGILNGYMPIVIRFLFPAYAENYFTTYVPDSYFLYQLNYFSPIGAAEKLCGGYPWVASERTEAFLFIVILIAVTLILDYFLFHIRPSEAAGQAMAFEKTNPFIRIALVIPLSLYVGLLLSLLTSIASRAWMIFGFVLGSILLHGIIESVFQFDIHGMWSKKREMFLCFVISTGFALLFWYDILGYNSYVPDLDEIASISIQTSESYSSVDDGIGMTGENMEAALQLAHNMIEQDVSYEDGKEWIRFKYMLKNGSIVYRDYYMDFTSNAALIDSIYASKDYKKDVCKLYTQDYKKVAYIKWEDIASETILYLSPSEMEQFFDTYLAEYTPFTYSQAKKSFRIGEFVVCNYMAGDILEEYRCEVYPEFTQSIAFLENYMSTQDYTQDYGSLTESVLYKYPITSLEIYTEETPVCIYDESTLEELKDNLILADEFYSTNSDIDLESHYEGSVSLETPNGIRYCAVIIPKDVADGL